MGDYPSRDEMLTAFGPFAVAFEPLGEDKTPYLSLLRLHDERASSVIEKIQDAACKENSEPHIVVLMQDANWRPHLVGVVANFYRKSTAAVLQTWRAVDAGSWVTPQLLAVLSLIDNQFVDRSIHRLLSGCPITSDPEYSLDSPIEKHVARGPAGEYHRACKAAAALKALLCTDFPDHEQVKQLLNDPELNELIAEDVDNSADTATAWRERFLEWVQAIPN